jgi:hypothetical protein
MRDDLCSFEPLSVLKVGKLNIFSSRSPRNINFYKDKLTTLTLFLWF